MPLAIIRHLYIDVATFGAGAGPAARFLHKGRAVGVSGRLIYREWLADDGSKRSKHSVIGRVQFLGRGQRSAEDVEADKAIAAVRDAFPGAKEITRDEHIPF